MDESTLIQKRVIQEGITEENGMLHFKTFEQFILTQNLLNETIDKREDAFVAAISGMSEEEAESYEELSGYNEDQPIIDFEKTYSFKSLRKKMSDDEAIYLSNWPTSIGSGPDHYIIDEVEQSLVNVDAEVRIGLSIFVFKKEATIEIYDASYETLEQVRATEDVRDLMDKANVRVYLQKVNSEEDYLKNGVGVGNPPPAPAASNDDCKNSKAKNGYYPNEGPTHRFKWNVNLWSFP